MTLAAAKEKLHDLIDHADEEKIFSLLSLFEENNERTGYTYSEETLQMLRERSEEYLSGKSKTYTVEESMNIINAQRKRNGL